MRLLLTFLTMLFCTAFAQAQSLAKVSGSVADGEGKPLSAATVSLLRAKDSSLAKLAVSDKAGIYEFVNIKPGTYLVSFTSVGYRKSFSKSFEAGGESPVEIAAVQLTPASSTSLAGVTVEAKKPFVETKLDRTIVNVEASPSSAGSTALEILEKSPGIMVNSDGVISLRGKQGVIVMIDGKPTYLSAGDLANLLKNMPATALDQVEIMTNPSAKYDASGNSGVINIKTKKTKTVGFNGSVTLGATTSIYRLDDKTYFLPKSQNSVNFNYRKNKVNLFGNYNPNFFKGRNTMNMDIVQIDSRNGNTVGYTQQETRFVGRNNNHTLKLGMDYYADKKNIFGVVASGFLFNGKPTPTTIANVYDVNHVLESKLVSDTKNDVSFRNFTGNLNWKHTFAANKELSADFDYVTYSNHTDMTLNTDIFNGTGTKMGRSQLRGDIPSSINIYSFRSDYVQPLKNGRLEAGFKTSIVRNDNLVNYENYDGSKWNRDMIRSNHFIYEENINAVYVSANQQIKKWSMQLGVRYENTNGKGDQITQKKQFTRTLDDFFPTAFVSYAANKKHTLTISSGRRIQRPNYQDLNPFIFFLDTLSYRQGNIYLKPQYTNNVELSHAFMGKFITTLAYNNTDDVISQIVKPDTTSAGKKRFLTPDNVARLENMSLSVTAPIKFTKWWNANAFLNVYNNHYTGVFDTIAIDLEFTSFMFNMTNSFQLGKGFVGEISGFYRHKAIDQLTKTIPMYQMSIAAQKQVMKGKGTVRLNVRDPFAWQRFGGDSKYGYVDMRLRGRPDSRQVTATFTYRFGKNTPGAGPRKRTTSSQDEQNRVGTGG